MIAACGQELLEITAGQPRTVDVQSVGTGPSYTTLRIHEHVQLQVAVPIQSAVCKLHFADTHIHVQPEPGCAGADYFWEP